MRSSVGSTGSAIAKPARMKCWTTLAVAVAVLCGCDGTAACMPETDLAFCARNEKDCEDYSGFDNCGASRTVACGTCELPETCGGGGVVNVCGALGVDAGLIDAGVLDDAGSDA